jgi:hypothetical protein
MYIRQIIEGILGLIICLLPIPEIVDHEKLKKVQMNKDRIKFKKENEFDEEKIKINK